MGGRSLIGGLRNAGDSPTLLSSLQKMAVKGGGNSINALGMILRSACSFSGDTEVLLADGSSKPISEVKVGDEVLALDPETGEKGPREVTRLWVHQDAVVKLEVDGTAVVTTEDHPYWNQTDRQWQRADELDRGDALLTHSGGSAVVGSLVDEGRTEVVYNLTVASIHTYYVLSGDTPVLVHNICDPAAYGAALGAELRSMSKGRTAALTERISAQGLSQADAAVAAESAAGAAFGATGGLHTLSDGRIVVLPAKIQPNAPVLVVDSAGAVRAGTADFGFDNKTMQLTVENVQTR
jgi:hypothetical protein